MISTFTVTGMTCGHCVAHVIEEVKAIPGVTDVEVDQTGPMRVTSEAEIDFEAIQAAVQEAGDYQVKRA